MYCVASSSGSSPKWCQRRCSKNQTGPELRQGGVPALVRDLGTSLRRTPMRIPVECGGEFRDFLMGSITPRNVSQLQILILNYAHTLPPGGPAVRTHNPPSRKSITLPSPSR